MKKALIIITVIFNLPINLYGWENKLTHPAITEQEITGSATKVDDYLKSQLGLSGGTATQLYWNFPSDIETRMMENKMFDPAKTKTILDWLIAGSSIEDEDGRKYSWRPRHHFYDPIRNSGLDNHADHPDWSLHPFSNWLPLGQSALNWTILGTALQEPFTNNEKWANARSIFYDSFRSTIKSVRNAQLAETMLKLGCIMHMLEDMGVPAHTRNDFLFAHYRSAIDNHNPLENWAEIQVKANNGDIPSGWLTGWTSQAKVFDKISKYWDTDSDTSIYIGSPSSAWGLAEQTNYQFLSTSTVFGCAGTLYQFPNPAKTNTVLISELRTGGEELYRYFQGYGVQHLARESYTHYFADEHGVYDEAIDSTNTPDDNSVYQDYVRVTVPRTIDYATGLLNYFFRGRLEIEPNCLDCNTVTFFIRNDSNNSGVAQTLKGGQCHILSLQRIDIILWYELY